MLVFLCLVALISSVIGVDERADTPFLKILPEGPQEVRRGKNLVLTCRASAQNLELVRDLRWFNPEGKMIPQDERTYSEEMPDEPATALFIKQVRSEDVGMYTCRAMYAANHQIQATVRISVYVGITWEDAPVSQYAKLGEDFKIRCKVRAEPPANIDWIKQSHIITSGDQFVIENDGLLIQEVKKENSGTYTCRARVPETGELEERDINLEVEEPPVWGTKPQDVVGIEAEKIELVCSASGNPVPHYSWVGPQGQDATSTDGWKLDEVSGTLTGYQVYGKDRGKYTCIAENNAGRIEASAQLDIIIRPRVEELYNATYTVGEAAGQLRCLASGQPLPNIIWRKWSNSEPYVTGVQHQNPRIRIQEEIVRAPDYTGQGETEWIESTLSIEDMRRSDDGLYECQAQNEGGNYFKSGHITVEFPPTFEDQAIDKEWSWDQRPVNLTCIATSIPNATFTWWYNEDVEIGRDDKDDNYEIIGRSPQSTLRIKPLSNKYYRKYRCTAHNHLGQADHFIELEEAREPGVINEAHLEKQTATSLVFSFVPPAYGQSLPIDSYAVEYKESRTEWNQSKRRVWPAGDEDAVYSLEGLAPFTTYDLRFSCRNRVGFSPWGATKQISTSNRGKPEPPEINRKLTPNSNDEENETAEVVEASHPNEYEVSWHIPQDNGVPIDFYLLSYSMVRKDGDTWRELGDKRQVEIPNRGTVSWRIQHLTQQTYYQIRIQAHNEMGFSDEDSIVIKTKQGEGGSLVQSPDVTDEGVPLVPILIAVLVLVILVLICIDLTCCKLYYKGVTYAICQKIDMCSKSSKGSNRKKSSVRGQSIINNQSSAGENTVKTAWMYNKSTEDLHQPGVDLQPSNPVGRVTKLFDHPEPEYENLIDPRTRGNDLHQPAVSPMYESKRKFTSEWILSNSRDNAAIPNLYDATPDHSILKNGLAKSLSQMCLDEPSSHQRILLQHPEKTTSPPEAKAQRHPRPDILQFQRNPRLTTVGVTSSGTKSKLVKVGPPTLPKPNISQRPRSELVAGTSATDRRNLSPHHNLDISEGNTAISPDWRYYGPEDSGKKVKDFGDFQIFSESPMKKQT